MKLTEGTRSALRAHVWHTDRAPDEQRAFRSRVTAVTRQFMSAGTIAALPLAILTWPLDYFAFRARGPALVWHITEWRLIVIGWCLGMLIGMRVLPQRTFAVIMELIEGASLEHERKRFGDREWALPLLGQIAAGLAAIHERGIVHRDLKPANILLADGTARIADFGLASLRNESFDATEQSVDPFLDSTQLQLTQPGSIFGTASYMAPELAGGAERAEPASDVFSFGVVAYEMLVGSPPFAEPPMLTRAHGRTIVPPAVHGLPPLLGKCLDVDPTRRPAASELARALADE